MLAASGRPSGPLGGWACEPKLDGWRVIVEVRGGRTRVTSRNGHDLTERVPSVGRLAELDGLVLDGELVKGDGSMTSFYGLFGALRRGTATVVAFDVLAVGDRTYVDQPYSARRAVLESLDLEGAPIVPSFDGDAIDALLAACGDHEMEGVVLKRRSSRYLVGRRSTDWRKVKCTAWREHLERRLADAR
jgi:bifunctional non-homologous end joining protein LigD